MRVSMHQGRSVRVLRSARSKSPFSPAEGIRYDGLYRITREEPRTNNLGGLYVRWRMERENGQAEIAMDRPTADEKRLAARVADGY